MSAHTIACCLWLALAHVGTLAAAPAIAPAAIAAFHDPKPGQDPKKDPRESPKEQPPGPAKEPGKDPKKPDAKNPDPKNPDPKKPEEGADPATGEFPKGAESGALTRFHKLLARDAGTWDAVVKSWPGPNVAPNVSKATETARLLDGGRWLILDLKGQVQGKPYNGHLVLGYDARTKRYVGTWIQTLSKDIVKLEGTWDDKNNARTLWFETACPLSNQPCKARLVTHYPDEDKRVMVLEMPAPQGKDAYYPVLELTMTRRAEKEKS